MNELLQLLVTKWQGDTPVYLLAVVLGVLLAGLAGWPARWLAHRIGAIDVPGGRHQHRRPTPRLGGLAVLIGVVGATLAAHAVLGARHPETFEDQPPFGTILLLAAGVCLLGVRDDRRSLSPLAKLGGLTVAAIGLLAAGVTVDFIEIPGLGKLSLGVFGGIVTIVWVLACTNAVNLIDGVDGLGAGTSAAACLALALLAHGMGDPATATVFMAIAGACGGFLLHNREPARMFLGDSGSLLLGFLFAALSAQGCTKRATALFLLACSLSLAVPLLDSTLAFVRRYRNAARRLGRGHWLAKLRATAIGDREHLHHRLLRRGHSHRRVARTLSLVTLLTGVSSLLLLPYGHTGWLAVAVGVVASTAVLWRLATLPPLLPPTATPAEKTIVLPSASPKRVTAPTPAEEPDPV